MNDKIIWILQKFLCFEMSLTQYYKLKILCKKNEKQTTITIFRNIRKKFNNQKGNILEIFYEKETMKQFFWLRITNPQSQIFLNLLLSFFKIKWDISNCWNKTWSIYISIFCNIFCWYCWVTVCLSSWFYYNMIYFFLSIWYFSSNTRKQFRIFKVLGCSNFYYFFSNLLRTDYSEKNLIFKFQWISDLIY